MTFAPDKTNFTHLSRRSVDNFVEQVIGFSGEARYLTASLQCMLYACNHSYVATLGKSIFHNGSQRSVTGITSRQKLCGFSTEPNFSRFVLCSEIILPLHFLQSRFYESAGREGSQTCTRSPLLICTSAQSRSCPQIALPLIPIAKIGTLPCMIPSKADLHDSSSSKMFLVI